MQKSSQFFIFSLVCLCLGLAWQVSDFQVFTTQMNINFLLFFIFYFNYIKNFFYLSNFTLLCIGFCFDVITASPMFLTSTILLTSAFVLRFYIRPIELENTMGLNGLVLFAAIILCYALKQILLFFFTLRGQEIAHFSIINELFYTLIFSLLFTPVLNLAYYLMFNEDTSNIKASGSMPNSM